jgi:hypothetical protein
MYQVRKAKVDDTALPAAVVELLGVPHEVRIVRDRATAFSWTLDEAGDGIAVARSARSGGLAAQVRLLQRLAKRGRKIRKIVVAPDMCGNRRFHERPDLLEVEESIRAGWCKFVAFTDVGRISRERDAAILFCEYLREEQVELVLGLGSRSQAVDLEDEFLINILFAASARMREDAILRARRQPYRRTS